LSFGEPQDRILKSDKDHHDGFDCAVSHVPGYCFGFVLVIAGIIRCRFPVFESTVSVLSGDCILFRST
jgi:hypothetical protein